MAGSGHCLWYGLSCLPKRQRFPGNGASLGWQDEIGTALDAWIAVLGGSRGGERWQRVGTARPTAEPGMYTVDIRGSDLTADNIDNLRLAGPEARSVDNRFPVMNARVDGQLLRIQVAEFASPPDPYLWRLKQQPTFLVTALRDGLAALTDAGLANLLVRGEVQGRPATITAPPRLLPAQQDAYRACMGSGLWLVWGPPGTGKTHVIQAAVSDLLTAGKRVLLVSGTNIAVDNALLGVIRDHRHQTWRNRKGRPAAPSRDRREPACLPSRYGAGNRSRDRRKASRSRDGIAGIAGRRRGTTGRSGSPVDRIRRSGRTKRPWHYWPGRNELLPEQNAHWLRTRNWLRPACGKSTERRNSSWRPSLGQKRNLHQPGSYGPRQRSRKRNSHKSEEATLQVRGSVSGSRKRSRHRPCRRHRACIERMARSVGAIARRPETHSQTWRWRKPEYDRLSEVAIRARAASPTHCRQRTEAAIARLSASSPLSRDEIRRRDTAVAQGPEGAGSAN